MSGGERHGRFIVLEGIDGSGTTTQSHALARWFEDRNEQAVVTSQPSRGPLGTMLREILRGTIGSQLPSGETEPVDPTTIALLFAADRLQHLESLILPNLHSGVHVICDRYVLSSYAYQTVDVDMDFVREINSRAPPPDLTLLLEVKPETAMARIDSSRSERDRFETLDFQRKVADNYRNRLAKFAGSPSVTIDGEMPIAEVTTAIERAVQGIL